MQLGEQKVVRAAKRHRCEWCGTLILKFEEHCSWTWIDETPFRIHMHLDCYDDLFENTDYGEEWSPYSGDRPHPPWEWPKSFRTTT
jgi:hypothetical protein